MRKQTKLVAVLSAAALLAIGASMTSFAATKGWVQEGEDWIYLDKDGEREANVWRRSGLNERRQGLQRVEEIWGQLLLSG